MSKGIWWAIAILLGLAFYGGFLLFGWFFLPIYLIIGLGALNVIYWLMP